jgi:hypothetical protein
MKDLKAAIAALLVAATGGAWAQQVTFDGATGVLTIPNVLVKIGGSNANYSVTFQLTNPATYTFTLTGATLLPAGPLAFASGYASNNRTVEGGEWGLYSGNFTDYANTFTGGGYTDQGTPAASSYTYLVVTTSKPTTDGYMGIFTAAPGYTIANPNAGVTLSGQTKLEIQIGVAAEFFAQPTNKNLTVRLVGAQVYTDGGSGKCQTTLDASVTPTTADLKTYTVPLSSFAITQNCNGGGFTSGITTAAQALTKAIGEIHVQAIFPQVNTTVKNQANEYPTGFTRGSVFFD